MSVLSGLLARCGRSHGYVDWLEGRVVHSYGWFIMETPIKIHDLGVSLFLETPIETMENLKQGSNKTWLCLPPKSSEGFSWEPST